MSLRILSSNMAFNAARAVAVRAATQMSCSHFTWLMGSRLNETFYHGQQLRMYSSENGSPDLPYVLKRDVADALEQGKPVVAIESSSFALGIAYPDNKQLAMDIVRTVKQHGAVPALLGVVDGQLRVGMSEHEVDKLVSDERKSKASKRNLAYYTTTGRTAATTVSSAIAIAELLGIQVVTTSSIGGVQQGGQDTLDFSSDLSALSKTPVAVVCSGVSPVYDIARTLEVLDTFGVTVLTLGEKDDFPALMCKESGCQSSGSLATPALFAKMLRAKKALGLKAGTVVAVPAPEHLSIANDVYESAVAQAELEASYEDMHGVQLNHYIFSRVDEITEHSLSRTMKGLLIHNATVGAQLAADLSALTAGKTAN